MIGGMKMTTEDDREYITCEVCGAEIPKDENHVVCPYCGANLVLFDMVGLEILGGMFR